MSEDLSIGSQTLSVWSPDPLKLLLIHALILVLVVKSGKEPGVKAHLGEEPSVGVGVAEWVELPTNSRCNTKVLEDESMSNHHVLNHILVDWAGLVMHRPPSIDQLKLAILHQLLDSILLRLTLLVIPHTEELHLDLSKLSIRMIPKRVNDGAQLVSHTSPLDASCLAIVVLLYCLQPADVVM